ncbi:hypothetical protein R84981_002883 [Carnimonas sp. R-84981]|uniref:terminase small subunit n=1 Tax=Carnimonas bestiolae TaxID=3402172 RepID=UPI003EDC3500
MATTAKGALTPKQSAFVDEYLKDLNATQAAIRAGYSEKTARSQGQRLLTNVDIQSVIQEAMDERANKAHIDSQYVLNRLVEIDQLDVADILDVNGNMLAVHSWPKAWRTSISGIDLQELMSGDVETIVRKLKFPDKVKNIELIGKHISVQAFREQSKSELTGEGGGPIKIQDMSKADMEALAKEFR